MQNDSSFHIVSVFKKYNVIAAYTARNINVGPVLSSNKIHIRNRKLFLSNLNIDFADLVYPEQIHKSAVAVVKNKCTQKVILKKDALITQEKNTAISIFTADCLPIFLYDPVKKVIALVHAGWRGSRLNIAKKTVNKMQKVFKTSPKDIIAFFGPYIRKCCYEVGQDFRRYFRDGLVSKGKKLFLDLSLVNKKQLISIGVKYENITDTRICTYCCNDKFFSYRKEGSFCGRMMSIMCAPQ